MKLTYLGPHLAVDVEEVVDLTVRRGESADVPEAVALRLLDQLTWARADEPSAAPSAPSQTTQAPSASVSTPAPSAPAQ